jgi:NAD(P)-dependent dehydrogenase (short-subunit alcohol dehydrogenase family)
MNYENDMFDLSGKKALVTGASKGFGAETAVLLAEAGADLSIAGRNKEGLIKTQKRIEALGRKCHIIQEDLSSAEGASKTAKKALDHWGTIDILVNNAGIFPSTSTLIDLSAEEWDQVLAVNLRAPFIIAKTLAPQMIKKGYGKIVNITSDAALIGQPGHGAYSASKGGLGMLTKIMAAEWGPHNIMANAVAPTVILTQMGKAIWEARPEAAAEKKAKIALKRFGQPKEVAELVLFLCSPASDFLCGATIPIDGGLTAIR